MSRRESGPKLGQEFVIEYGRVVTLEDEGLEVRFASVTSDSRCPSDPDVRCVWEGFAQIVVRIGKDGTDAASIKLNTPNPLHERYPSHEDYLDYKVELIELDPYPRTAGGIEAAQYAATLLITSS